MFLEYLELLLQIIFHLHLIPCCFFSYFLYLKSYYTFNYFSSSYEEEKSGQGKRKLQR